MEIVSGTGALVVGGSSGLGAATARRLSRLGARVVVADVQDRHGRELADTIGGLFVHTDVRDDESVVQAVAAADEARGGLRVLVVCAGITRPKRIVGRSGAAPLESFATEVSINLIGTINVLRLAAASMAGNEPVDDGVRGVCILTSSIAAFDGQRGNVGYAASKAGVAGLTLPAARDLAEVGVRVVTIAPGVFGTPMVEALPEAARRSIAEQELLPKRSGRPDEYAALIEHVVANTMINGEVIRLDGGVRLPAR